MKNLWLFIILLVVFNPSGKRICSFGDECVINQNRDGSFFVLKNKKTIGFFPVGFGWVNNKELTFE